MGHPKRHHRVLAGAGPLAGLYGAVIVGFFAACFGGTPSQVWPQNVPAVDSCWLLQCTCGIAQQCTPEVTCRCIEGQTPNFSQMYAPSVLEGRMLLPCCHVLQGSPTPVHCRSAGQRAL